MLKLVVQCFVPNRLGLVLLNLKGYFWISICQSVNHVRFFLPEVGASVVGISAGGVVGACVVVVVVISAFVTTASSEIRVLGVASDDGVAAKFIHTFKMEIHKNFCIQLNLTCVWCGWIWYHNDRLQWHRRTLCGGGRRWCWGCNILNGIFVICICNWWARWISGNVNIVRACFCFWLWTCDYDNSGLLMRSLLDLGVIILHWNQLHRLSWGCRHCLSWIPILIHSELIPWLIQKTWRSTDTTQ